MNNPIEEAEELWKKGLVAGYTLEVKVVGKNALAPDFNIGIKGGRGKVSPQYIEAVKKLKLPMAVVILSKRLEKGLAILTAAEECGETGPNYESTLRLFLSVLCTYEVVSGRLDKELEILHQATTEIAS